MKILTGIPASDGISLGVCRVVDRKKLPVRRRSIKPIEIPAELNRLKFAVESTAEFIENSKNISKDDLTDDLSFIFDIYLMLLRDNMLIGEAENIIKENLVNAEYALTMSCGRLTAQFDKSANEYLRERRSDIESIVQKILRFMTGKGPDAILSAGSSEIVIAHDLSPSDTAYMNKKNIRGFVTDLGSRTAHTSILARSLEIPAVVGLGDVTEVADTGDFIIIDGFEGIVIIDPDRETIQKYRQKDGRYAEYIRELARHKDEDSVTLDGVTVNLYSNIELNSEFYLSNEYRSSGVGLYRTEYIYMQHGNVDEETQYGILKDAAEQNMGKPLVIRTFDLGAEKLAKYMPHPSEKNPAMGLRAVRYSLRHYDFFIKQLRAILRVSAEADVRIMFPMISGMEEFHKCREAVEAAKKELRAEGVPFNEDIKTGVMIELPSIAVISDIIAKEADFFSIGTNDLIQYTIGIDRNNEYVAYLYRPCHPAVRRLLKTVADNAEKAGIECTVCGETAGEPKYIPLLLGLGYRSLSMSPASLLKARMIINSLSIKDCEEMVRELNTCAVAADAENRVREFIVEKCGSVFFH
ncbi:MAG: phosphoenolpyruvate--protein phosphotransferase [Deferribacterales bacterium]